MTFVKGKSGNPKGRPKKGTALSDLLDKALKAKGESGKPQREAVIDTLINLALAGDLDAIKVIFDRIDGKTIERREVSGPEGGPVEVKTYVSISPDDWPGFKPD